ncbi:hypothetical protein ACVINU_007787 [Bradyrhizobium diazoefficiens]
MADFALPFSGECLKSITDLTNIGFADMNAWSQRMIEGIANYGGDSAVEARCHAATSGIDAAIDDILLVMRKNPDQSILGVLLASGMSMERSRAWSIEPARGSGADALSRLRSWSGAWNA